MSWIKIEHDLTTSPKFVTLASRLRHGRVTVLGACVTLWMLADKHAVQDRLHCLTLDGLDALVDMPGFGQAMVEVGWLRVHEGCLEVVDYQRHNGYTAKARALNAKRAQASRYRHATVTVERDATAPKRKRKNKNKESSSLRSEDFSETQCAEDGPAVSTPAAALSQPPKPLAEEVETFPCDGMAGIYTLRADQVSEWQKVFPHLDVAAECKKAGLWLKANPERRKTAKGMPKFLLAWLNRCQDNRRTAPNQIFPASPSRAGTSTRPMSERAAEIRARRAHSGQEIHVQIARDTIPGLGVTHG